ncbi:MAG: protease pro-enzyme activation domain-containing protein [Acidobacteriota bacterium]
MQRRRLFPLALGLVLTLVLVPGLFAQGAGPASCGTIGPINNNDTIVLRGNVNPLAQPQADYGFADPARPMNRIILTLKMSPSRQAALDRLLAEQQDPTSPRFHHWLSPEEFGRRFGPSREELATITNWLKSQGFTIDEVAKGRLWINFSGNVAEVESAFHTEIHRYYVAGVMHHANATDPSIPKALSGVVAGIVSLDDFPRQAMNVGFQKLSPQDAAAVYAKYGKIAPQWSGTANGTAGVYASPIDWATIYDAKASYSANGTGTGVTIGIVGRTNPGTTNWSTFRSILGLPVNTPTIIVNGTNPGDLGAGEDGEADLDAEWSGGVAPGATVKFVASASTSSTDGVDLSAQYIVNNNLADVMSTSFGSCESAMGSAENTFYNNLWSQAASQGITACVSTGDSGPAGCASGSATSGSGQSGVNGLASTPYDIAVGATELSNSSSYWNASGAAVSYIPETPWNESGTVSGGSGLWSTSSGASTIYAKPSWQSAPGVPSASHRYLPDVCLDGSDMFFGNYGMLVYTQGAMATTGGTSAASPSFAGLMALVVQKYGRQGNANTKLYQLGTAQYNRTGPAVFHDITSGNNNVPGLTGFTAATGWDEVTGLGTVDVNALVNNWNGTTATYGISGTVSGAVTSGVTMTLSGAASATTTTASGGTYSFAGLANGTYTVTPSKSGYTFTPASASETVNGASITGVNFTATANPPSTYTISGTITLSGAGLSGVTVTAGSASATTSSTGAYTISGLANGTYTVTPSKSGYTFSPASASETVNGANIAGVNFTATASSGGTVTLLSDGFESTTGWGVAAVSGSTASWSQVSSGTYPSASPHGGSYMADFDSYSANAGDEARFYRTTGFAVPSNTTSMTLTFWMYHDTQYSSYNDQVQAQVSTNGSTWTNVGSAVSRYNGSTGWAQVTINLGTTYNGAANLQVGFLGISGYGNDEYIDDVAVVAQTGTPPPTYSISGTVTLSGSGLSGVKVVAGSASTTTNSSGAYTLSGLVNGTYTVTPSLSGYTFTPAGASETVNGANIAGVNFTATKSAGPTTLFSDGFENGGWSTAQVSGTQGAWTMVSSGTYPSASPHSGSKMADFNSWTSASGSKTRLYRASGFAVASTYSTVTLTFWMYHDTQYSSYNDQIQVQVSTNGTSWTNVGSPISRYNGTTGWAQSTLDLSAYKGQTVYLAFLGISGYGNDEYLDDVRVTAQ